MAAPRELSRMCNQDCARQIMVYYFDSADLTNIIVDSEKGDFSVGADTWPLKLHPLVSIYGEGKGWEFIYQECAQDGDCSVGQMCAWGQCSEGDGIDDRGLRCDPTNDQCSNGFCCSNTESLEFPTCIPFPTEGEQCRSQTSGLLTLINPGSAFESFLGFCPCAEGLVCTNKGGKLLPTCERPDEVLDFTAYQGESLFQPLIRRDDELTYYDVDLTPWTSQDDLLAVVDLPRAVEESEREAEKAFKVLGEDIVDSLEGESLQFDEAFSPSQLDFQELKQLAKQTGQYLGPGLY
ncbi:uncharacterized protein RCH25_008043 [Pelodytes ibericus]